MLLACVPLILVSIIAIQKLAKKLLSKYWTIYTGLGLARVFLQDSPLLLFNEPTSKLDSLNEGIILKSIKEECKDKTVVLISHRKSTMNIAHEEYSV